MTTPIAAIHSENNLAVAGAPDLRTNSAGPNAFASMLMQGIDHVNATSAQADAMVTAFALDDSVPPHQVMFALQQAHNSLALMMQVRSRLTEAYQEIMRMQL